jgi:hypothetical protein
MYNLPNEAEHGHHLIPLLSVKDAKEAESACRAITESRLTQSFMSKDTCWAISGEDEFELESTVRPPVEGT